MHDVSSPGSQDFRQVLRRHPRSAQSAGAACGLLRQLAGSDAVKAQIALEGGLEAVRDVLETHLSSAAALEQAVGLLAALTLRSPDTALAAAEAGLADALLQVCSNASSWNTLSKQQKRMAMLWPLHDVAVWHYYLFASAVMVPDFIAQQLYQRVRMRRALHAETLHSPCPCMSLEGS